MQDYTKKLGSQSWLAQFRRTAGVFVLACGTISSLNAHADAKDDAFLAARAAFASGNRAKLAKAMESIKGHDLEPWAQYYQLRLQLDESSNGVPDFLKRYQGSLIAERLRSDWVKALGKRGQLDDVAREYALLQQPDVEAQCYAIQSKLSKQNAVAFDETRALWLAGNDLPESCRSATDTLVKLKLLDANDIWERVRRLLEAKKPGAARTAARYLPDAQIPDARALDAITDNPSRFLTRLPNAYFDAARDNRRNRETLMYAIGRIASNDPTIAAEQWKKIEANFPATERAYGWGQVALQAARRHLPDAGKWFVLAEGAPMSEEQLAWQVRSALRAADWPTVRRTIQRMPAAMAALPDWTYWNARALATQGKQAEAKAAWQRIATLPNFYGNLSADELGIPLTIPTPAPAITSAELNDTINTPGFKRALTWFRLDQRTEGVKEWNWTLRGMNDRQLLAAAEHAKRNEIYDRAISAADRTIAQHDYSLRYLSPYRSKVEEKSKNVGLDPGWVFGLMRQESRFVIQAKSNVGAQGLMQVMPATARWVAKKIGLESYHPKHAMDMDTNITLGTNYMKMVLGGLDNHPVLASAAYNAGPGRAKRWRGDVALEGAIYAECIPFAETRDYVKKVMSNTMYYAALFDEKPQSLKSRLGIIRPRGNGDSGAEALP